MNPAVRFIGSAAMGCVFGVPGVYYFMLACRLRAWPFVPGTVVSSGLQWGNNAAYLTLEPTVRYAYSVNGKSYEGTSLTMADWILTAGLIQARSYQRRFPIGKEVTVYYDPANPSKSVLIRPSFVMPVILIVSGIFTFLFLWKYGRQLKAG